MPTSLSSAAALQTAVLDKDELASLPAFQRTAIELRDRIISGRLQAGQPLAEQELASEWGISRNTVREALRFLHGEGLVEYRHNHGVSVRCLSRQDVRDIYRTRRYIELMAVQLPETITHYHLDRLRQPLDLSAQAAASDDWQAVGTYSLRFHQCLVHMLGSARLDAFFTVLVAQQRLLFASGQYESAFQQPWLERDRRLWQLLSEQRLAEVAQMLMTYLEESERQIMDTFAAPRERLFQAL
ncbi:GntR family transcriptional regulator [Zymobacter palmae]|uniref:Transcriptional regulators n=1 Tax=Zymobacter palmae TaxID=33074 RepID=A0A348HEU8_9GAMM|nr:GntR family transcriptional regulator [Zymobacter palmae]BBG30150.1 transcriptional regulators [Zymobacter palmae]